MFTMLRKRKNLLAGARTIGLQLKKMEDGAFERIPVFQAVQLSRHKQSEIAWEWMKNNGIAEEVRRKTRFGKKILRALSFTHIKPGLM